MTKYRIEKRQLSVAEYQSLRKTTGWDMLADKVVETALKQDLFSIGIFDHDAIIGMGRIIGDGGLYFYIQDVVVKPEYHGQGIGKLIMQNIESYLERNAPHNAFIGLMAADGVKDFYYKFGYKERPDHKPGMFKIRKTDS